MYKTIKQLAKEYNVPDSTIRIWISRGNIPQKAVKKEKGINTIKESEFEKCYNMSMFLHKNQDYLSIKHINDKFGIDRRKIKKRIDEGMINDYYTNRSGTFININEIYKIYKQQKNLLKSREKQKIIKSIHEGKVDQELAEEIEKLIENYNK